MYTKQNRIISNKAELANYIEDFDVYNSKLIEKLRNPALSKNVYEITVYEYRPDLIAQDFYGSTTYTGLVILQCGIGLESYTKGTVLSLLSKSTIDSILGYI